MTTNLFTDEGHIPGRGVAPTLELPYAFIDHGDRITGAGGGLCFKESQIAAAFPAGKPPTGFTPDPKLFKEKTLRLRDPAASRGWREERAYLAERYHLIVLSYDHDAELRPAAWHNQWTEAGEVKRKMVFNLVAYVVGINIQGGRLVIPEPFRLKYGGSTNAIRMEHYIEDAINFCVATASRYKREEAARKGREATDCGLHEFLLPVRHEGEIVGSGQESGCSAVQWLEEGWVYVGKKERGTSVLEKYKDPARREDLLKLYYGVRQPDLLRAVRDAAIKYASSSKLVTDKPGKRERADHFSGGKARAETLDEVVRVCRELRLEAEREMKILVGRRELRGGDESSKLYDLNQSGAELLLAQLRKRLDDTRRKR